MRNDVGQREMKHVAMFQAIEKLFSTSERLSDVIDKIEGLPKVKSDQKDSRETPSLAQFLSEQPDTLLKLNADLATLIDRLESLIF